MNIAYAPLRHGQAIMLVITVLLLGTAFGLIMSYGQHQITEANEEERMDAFYSYGAVFLTFHSNIESDGMLLMMHDHIVVKRILTTFKEGENRFTIPQLEDGEEFFVIIDRDDAAAEIGKFWMSGDEPIWWPGEGE